MHSDAPTAAATDWPQILALYDQLLAVAPSPVVALTSTLGYSGFLLGPPAIGFLASEFGLRAGLTTLSFLALVAAAIAWKSRDQAQRRGA